MLFKSFFFLERNTLKVHRKLFRCILESMPDLVRVAGDAEQRITLCRLATLRGRKRAEIERIATSARSARGADPRAHANERDEKEARHSSFNYKFH